MFSLKASKTEMPVRNAKVLLCFGNGGSDVGSPGEICCYTDTRVTNRGDLLYLSVYKMEYHCQFYLLAGYQHKPFVLNAFNFIQSEVHGPLVEDVDI